MTTARTQPGTSPRPVLVGGPLRVAFAVTLVVALSAVAFAALTTGPAGVRGALIGSGMVLVFFGLGALVVNAVASVSPALSLLVALLTYLLQIVLVGLVFVALTQSGALDETVHREWLGGSVIAATLAWMAAQVISATRSRQPLYDLPDRPSDGQEANAR